MNRLLITGGAGFIGSNFVHYWRRRFPDDLIVVLDKLTYAGNRSNLFPGPGEGDNHSRADLNANFEFVEGDICDKDLVLSLLIDKQLNLIVNLAAESHVDRSILGPDAFIQTNIVGTHSLLEAAREAWLGSREVHSHHRFHQVSTDEVFGSLQPGQSPFHENSPYSPSSPYSASKASADHLVTSYHRTYDLNTTISYCTNNYGPYQHIEKLIPKSISLLLNGKRISVYGDGLNIRDWMHVQDHCQGLELVLRQGKPGECYNLAAKQPQSNLQLLQLLCVLLTELMEANPDITARFPHAAEIAEKNVDELIEHVADRPGHDRGYGLSTSKSRQILGYSPEFLLRAGLKDTVEWYLSNTKWWQSLES